MTSSQDQFREFLAMQRVDYRRALPDKLAQLQAQWNAVAAGAATPRLGELERLAHTLAGTAGTFGLQEVSLAARSLELLLAAAGQGSAALTAAQRAQITLAVSALLACARE